MATTHRPLGVVLLSIALGLQGLSGLGGGLGLMYDRSGAWIGLPLEWLHGSVFTSYFIPGLILASLLGVVPLTVMWFVWTKRGWYSNAALLVGVTLLAWIAIEVLVVGYQAQPPLQLIYGILAVFIIGLSLFVRRSARRSNDVG